MFGFRRRQPTFPLADWPLGHVLFRWTDRDAFTIGDSLEGVTVFGMTGSGKSSTSGRLLAQAYLRAGYGGLVCCAKPGEADVWADYCRTAGRTADIIRFGPGHPARFNPLLHEMTRTSPGAGQTHNAVALLEELLAIGDRVGGVAKAGGGGGEDSFWRQSVARMMRNGVELLHLAGEPVSVPALHRLILSAPPQRDALASDAWRAGSYCFQLLRTAEARSLTPVQTLDLAAATDYWLAEFAGLAEKTRSIIIAVWASLADPLSRGHLRELFSTTSTITPEAARAGKVIVLDLPIHTWGAMGLYAQCLFKRSFQLAMERTQAAEDHVRPCFLFADEAQFFLTPSDASFQQTCRSARTSTVYLTQNLNNLYAVTGGGERARAEVHSLLANMNTTIAHANTCPQTNEHLSALAGKRLQYLTNFNRSSGEENLFDTLAGLGPGCAQVSAGGGEQWAEDLRPEAFGRLRTGGVAHRGTVDAIVFRAARQFAASGKSWQRVALVQARR